MFATLMVGVGVASTVKVGVVFVKGDSKPCADSADLGKLNYKIT